MWGPPLRTHAAAAAAAYYFRDGRAQSMTAPICGELYGPCGMLGLWDACDAGCDAEKDENCNMANATCVQCECVERPKSKPLCVERVYN